MTCRSAATVALLVCFGGEDDRAERCVCGSADDLNQNSQWIIMLLNVSVSIKGFNSASSTTQKYCVSYSA